MTKHILDLRKNNGSAPVESVPDKTCPEEERRRGEIERGVEHHTATLQLGWLVKLVRGIIRFPVWLVSFMLSRLERAFSRLAGWKLNPPDILSPFAKGEMSAPTLAKGSRGSGGEESPTLAKGGRGDFHRYRLLASLTMFLVFAGGLFMVLRQPKAVEASWWDDMWHYRKLVDITSSSDLSDYTIKIILDTSTLISEGKLRTDCADIRVMDANGALLPHWIETAGTNTCNTSVTWLWTKMSLIPSSGTSVHVYYGNPGAADITDGKNTFAYYNDVEDGLNDFDTYTDLPPDNVVSQDSSQYRGGWYSAKLYDNSTAGTGAITYLEPNVTKLMAKWSARPAQTGKQMFMYFRDEAATNGVQIFFEWTTAQIWYNDGTSHNIQSYSANTWYDFEMRADCATDTFDLWINGTKVLTGAGFRNAIDSFDYFNFSLHSTQYPMTMYVDNLAMSTLASTEPTVGTPSSEEQGTSPIAYWPFDEGQGTTAHNAMERGVTDGLVSWWKFDEGTGTTAYDAMGLNDLTLDAIYTPTWATGQIANALDFESSSNQYAYAADSASLSITGDLTLSAWIKPESVTAATIFAIAGKVQSSDADYSFIQYGDELRLYIDSNSDYSTTDAVNLSTGTWYHVAAIYSATDATIRFYVNGEEYASTVTGTIPNAIADTSNALYIAGIPSMIWPPGSSYDGIIDSLKLYNRALTPEDIAAEYESLHAVMVDMDATTAWTEGATASSSQEGMGKALEFDGTDDYLLVQ
ncbi:MAG TPA: DUF2341 domain-containing protein, partial [bacterium]|nr:DUF2341 domain-containing protein [bacterium]